MTPAPDRSASSGAAGPEGGRAPTGRLPDWAPSRTQALVLAIGLLAASNIAQWIALGKTPDSRPVTVVAVRQMSRDYLRKTTSPTLTEQQSVQQASLFVTAAQDELHHMVAPGRLVLARECVLSGTLNDITAALQQRVEARLGQDAAPVSAAGPANGGIGDPITGGPISAASLLSPAAAQKEAP